MVLSGTCNFIAQVHQLLVRVFTASCAGDRLIVLAVGEEDHGTACGRQFGHGFDGRVGGIVEAGALVAACLVLIDGKADGGDVIGEILQQGDDFIELDDRELANHPGCC